MLLIYASLNKTRTDESGYTLTFDYDALDRITKVTFPDGTFSQYTYHRLDLVLVQDRAGRQTLLEYDAMRQMTKRTDPLNRVTRYQWCSCGELRSLTDPMGRTTSWNKDVQGRLTSKQYGDGSQISYLYENATSRTRQVIDEKQQATQFTFNRDDTVRSIAHLNTSVPTPAVTYAYDPDYRRPVSMTDGIGTTLYSYNLVTASPALGAGQLASIDGPLPNDTITYAYDDLGRRVSTAINGVARVMNYDAAARVVSETNVLGAFTRTYDGASSRMNFETFPNGQTTTRTYGGSLEDRVLQQITYQVGATPISEFIYGHDNLANQIVTWSQRAGSQSPSLYHFGYDAANQLISGTVTNAGMLQNAFGYTYDPLGNRLTEQIGATTNAASYNALNQISAATGGAGLVRTNEWDGENHLAAVNAGDQRTEFAYDGLGRLASIRKLLNGVELSHRRLVWCDDEICEERDAAGSVTKRFFSQGMKVESGPASGSYYYTRDHLGSIRELTDGNGNVRARYSYDPFGRRTRLTGDATADFAFAGMFYASEAELSITWFRAYDPELGRWLSRDALNNAEVQEGPNLYTYAANDPISVVDSLGLCCESKRKAFRLARASALEKCLQHQDAAAKVCDKYAQGNDPRFFVEVCGNQVVYATKVCADAAKSIQALHDSWDKCVSKACSFSQQCSDKNYFDFDYALSPKDDPWFNEVGVGLTTTGGGSRLTGYTRP